MENTALTRQATRARIGPWYVMQARNPAAPGMKCSTLLALIRKGQVTSKSVIRGPTTHQFWRFAARVKGISREFGVCFSCGTRLDSKAVECPRCGKGQELPANPDTLLEGDLPTGPVGYEDVKSFPPPADDSRMGHAAVETATLEMDNLKSRRPVTPPEPATGPTEAEEYSVAVPSPTAVPPPAKTQQPPTPGPVKPNLAGLTSDSGSRPRQQRPKRQDNVLTARDLATAFSLQYEPYSRPGQRRKSRLGRAIVMTIVLLLMGGGALIYFVPSLQDKAIAEYHQLVPQSSGSVVTPVRQAHVTTPAPSDTPPWSAKLPKVETPITTPTAPVAAPETPVAAPTAPSNSSETKAPAPQPAAANLPPASSDAGAVAASDEDLDQLAMKLHNQGLDAEARHDYASAVGYYQQIEKLPREHWPADTQELLNAAQQRAAAAANGR